MKNEKLVNRYTVLEKLGEGGMGTVWKVNDEILGMDVALKEIKLKDIELGSMPKGSFLSLSATAGSKSSAAELRFSEEFRTMNKLQYPYTLKVFDYGILDNGNKYLTMEIVDGENVKDLLKKRQLSFDEIYRILVQSLQTLNFIHSRLYVHRDIKSENITLQPNGNIKLMDFGLMDRLGILSDGTLSGTASYMPPEVMKGGVINESSDLYSLGILAYELVTGTVPFQSDKIVEVLKMHTTVMPEPLSKIRSDIDPEFEAIVMKLLAKEQHGRYQNAPEVIEAISKIYKEEISGETIEQKKSYLFCSQLIGRDEERKTLSSCLEGFSKGEGSSLFIQAPAGVGKSRLLQELKLEAQLSNIAFLEGVCAEQGMEIYHPFRQALKPLILKTKKSVFDECGAYICKLFPELEKKGYKPAPSVDELTDKSKLYDSIEKWLKEISKEMPIIICLEDLHWSDSATTELLNACIQRLSKSPVTILGTFRDDEVDEMSPIYYTLEEELTKSIVLNPLDLGNTQMLINAMLGHVELSEDFIGDIFKATGGNPFFVTEVMRSLIEEEQIVLDHGLWKVPPGIENVQLPDTIESTIMKRLKSLSENAFSVIQTAAVLGKEIDVVMLKGLMQLENENYFSALDELIERQFILKEDNQYYFTHDRVREALYGQLDEVTKKKLHKECGLFIEERNKNNLLAKAHVLAYHFERSDDKQKAVEYLIMASQDSIAKGSYIDFTEKSKRAITLLEEIDYPDKEKVLFEARARFVYLAWFDYAFCISTYEKILPTLYGLAGGEEKLKKQVKIFEKVYKVINFFPEKIAEKLKDKLAKVYVPYQIPKAKDYPHIIQMIVELSLWTGISYYLKGDLPAQEAVAAAALSILPEKEGSIGFACVTVGKAGAFAGSERSIMVVDDLKKSIEIFKKYEHKLTRVEQLNFCAAWFWHNNCEMLLGRFKKELYDQHRGLAEKTQILDQVGWSFINYLNHTCSMSGEYPQAMEAKKDWEEWVKKLGRIHAMECWYNILFANLSLGRGEFVKVENYLVKVKKLLPYIQGMAESWYRYLNSCLYLGQGKIEEGLPILEDCVSFCEENDLDRLSEARGRLVELYADLGRMDEAAELLKKALERATSKEYFNYMNQSFLYSSEGYMYLKQKNYEKSQAAFEKSLKIAQEKFSSPIREGWCLLRLAQLAATLTQTAKARDYLEKATEQFKVIENDYLLDKVKEKEKKLDAISQE